jgi:hypothetical protein
VNRKSFAFSIHAVPFFSKKKGDITISDWQSQSDIEMCKIKNA